MPLQAFYDPVTGGGNPSPTYNPPRNVSLTTGNAQIFVNFDSPLSGVPTGYRIRIRNTATGQFAYVPLGSNPTLPVTLNLLNDVQYAISVQAEYSGGSSFFTVEKFATPQAPSSFPGVTGFSATAGDQSITLNWTPPNQPNITDIQARLDDGTQEIVSLGPNPPRPRVLTPALATIVNGVTYGVSLRVVYGSNFSTWSTVISVTPQEDTDPPPTATDNPDLIDLYQTYARRRTSLGSLTPIWLKNTGNDSNTGSSEANAVRTLTRALSLQSSTANSIIVLASDIAGYTGVNISGGRTLRICSRPGFHYKITGSSRPRMSDSVYYLNPAKYPDYTLFYVTGTGGNIELYDVSFCDSFGDGFDIRGQNIELYGERVAFHDNEGHGLNCDDASSGTITLNVFKVFNNRNYRWFTNNPNTGSFDWSDGLKGSGALQIRARFGVIYNNSDDGIDFWATRNRGASQLLEYCYIVGGAKFTTQLTRQNSIFYPKNSFIIRFANGGGFTPTNTIDGLFVYRCIQAGTTAPSAPGTWPKLNSAPSDEDSGKPYLDSQPTVSDGSCVWQVYSAYCANGNGGKLGGSSPSDKDLDINYCVFADNREHQVDDNHGANVRLNHCTIIKMGGKFSATFDKDGIQDQIRNTFHDGISTYNGSTEPLQQNNSQGNAADKFISLVYPEISNPTENPLTSWWWKYYISDFAKPKQTSPLRNAATDGTDIGALQYIDLAN